MHVLRLALAVSLLFGCDAPHFVPDDAGPRLTGVEPPPRTTRPDGPDEPPRILILRDVRIVNDGHRGWDLDARCTLPPTSPTGTWEHECAPTSASGEHVVDLEGCRDDAWATEVAGAFGPLGAQLELALATSMNDGVGPLMVRVSGWDGGADDPSVLVEIVPVAFGVPSGGVRGDLLAWDGSDAFHPFAAFVEADGRAVLRDEEAYVSDGVLVARLLEDPVFPFRARDRSMTLRLGEAMLTLTFLEGGGATDAVLTGRWPIDDALAELDHEGLCAGDPLRRAAEIRIRDSADVRERSRGGAGMTAPCEALSISLGFTPAAGLWGDVLEPDTELPTPCAPAP
ncbi:MAG: hypothetical protein KC619_20400 [Myxococcales bacterium]|nr:hypothetical protein [Myxococcales bacterium]